MLNQGTAQAVIAEALKTGGDFAEIFLEDRLNHNLSMLSGKIESVNSRRLHGVNISASATMRGSSPRSREKDKTDSATPHSPMEEKRGGSTSPSLSRQRTYQAYSTAYTLSAAQVTNSSPKSHMRSMA